MTHNTNSSVIVTSLGFKKNLAAYPRRIEYRGISYNFIDAGLRCMIRSGSQVIEILTMTDGDKTFRLRSDNRGGTWTLLGVNF